MKQYVGIQVVQAEREDASGIEGYKVIDHDGNITWESKADFEHAFRECDDITNEKLGKIADALDKLLTSLIPQTDREVLTECPIAKHNIKARDIQIGGDHYKKMGVEPWDVVDTWSFEQRIGAYRHGALKYTMRMGTKDENVQEIRNGMHYMQKLVEVLEERDDFNKHMATIDPQTDLDALARRIGEVIAEEQADKDWRRREVC